MPRLRVRSGSKPGDSARMTGHHSRGTGGLRPARGLAVVAGLGGDHDGPELTDRVEQRLHHRERATGHVADRAQGGVDEERVAGPDAQRGQGAAQLAAGVDLAGRGRLGHGASLAQTAIPRAARAA